MLNFFMQTIWILQSNVNPILVLWSFALNKALLSKRSMRSAKAQTFAGADYAGLP
jgi:hypothetical protein